MSSAAALRLQLESALAHRIPSALKVTPTDTAHGRVFCVSGAVGLFSSEDGALLSNQEIPTIQQYTLHVNFEIPLYADRKSVV